MEDDARATAVRLVSAPASGGIWRAGETIRVEADFSEPVVVRGTPGLALHILRTDGTEGAFEAVYSGIGDIFVSGIRAIENARLQFDLVVPEGLSDGNGISVPAEALRLKGSSIVARSDGSAVTWPLAATNLGGLVGSTGYRPASGGVCDRTPRCATPSWRRWPRRRTARR